MADEPWEKEAGSWKEIIAGIFARKVVVEEAAILSAIWDATPADQPDPELYSEGQIGADTLGVAAGLTYHVVGAVGSKAWVATGGTIKNLYGGV